MISTVLELRRYRLHPGGREVLIDLFERYFHRGQEEVGIEVLGEFRDLDDPDAFVWMRGFASMEDRRRALTDFYVKGEIWRRHREQANATMISSDDVLLLRPTSAGLTLTETSEPSVVEATVYPVDGTGDFRRFFEDKMAPLLTATGARLLGQLETEPAENTFPALPVREGENVFVSLVGHPDAEALALRRKWFPAVREGLTAAPQHLRLAPTRDSRLR